MKIGDLEVHITGGTDGQGGGRGPVVVLLHGFGAAGDDLVPLSNQLGAPEGTRFVFPEAPIDLGVEYMGGRAWWWIDLEERVRRRELGQEPDIVGIPDGLVTARAKIDDLLGEIERSLRPPPGKIVLGGFSQGAMLSLDVALRSNLALSGLVLMSGTHIAAGEWKAYFDRRKRLPVFMSHGRSDELLPFSVSEKLGEILGAHGMQVEWVPFRGGHGIPANVAGGAGAFLRRVLGAESANDEPYG